MKQRVCTYLVIEDYAMMSLRTKIDWGLKGMLEEVLSPLVDYLRNEIYFLGLRRILFQLNRGKDFKLIASWQGGVIRGFQHFCRSLERWVIDKTRSSYALVATCKDSRSNSIDRDILALPFHNNQREIGKYAIYIARDTLLYYKNRVGRCEGGTLFISSPRYSRTDCTTVECCDDMEILSEKSQTEVVMALMKGHDFILSPYGHSLQMLMQYLTSR